jgi:geranylgeranyl diphosphate synthase type II
MEPRLQAALADVLSRPGSLVRAVVAYLSGIEMGMREESARALACGLEYLHTASLIFDDLPAMDDASLRRGGPCLHLVHGQAIAMLAALALVNRGYSLLWQGMKDASPDRRIEAGELIDECLGVDGLIAGQAYDLAGWHGSQDAANVAGVAARKTAALLRLTLLLPALCGRGTRREIQLLDRLAMLRGLAYQVADDIKDDCGNDFSTGKTVGRDSDLGRPNVVAAEGLQGAMQRFRRLQETGDRVTSVLPGHAGRWGMLELLRVPEPSISGSLPQVSAAV